MAGRSGSDGLEITQFTYFQQVGGIDLRPVSVELTYGLERIAMYLQGVDNVYEVLWTDGVRYGDIHHRTEVEFSKYNFETADVSMHLQLFALHEAESLKLLAEDLILPAYDHCLKCSHLFNVLDARGAISVSERTDYIARIRKMARGRGRGIPQPPRGDGLSPSEGWLPRQAECDEVTPGRRRSPPRKVQAPCLRGGIAPPRRTDLTGPWEKSSF